MDTTLRILKWVLTAAIVVILGATLGWYAFVNRSIDRTSAQDAARGLGIAPSFGSPQGSTFSNTFGGAPQAAEISSSGAKAPRLWPISKTPIAGLGFVGTSSSLYFVERASGNVLRADPLTSALTRMTNTTLPKIYEAVFSGDTVFLRSVDGENVTTYAASIQAATTTGEVGTLEGVYLPQGIVDLAVRKNQLFFLIQSPSGGILGVTSDLRGQAQKRIFSSALAQWRVHGTPDGSLYLAQRAADDISGYSFSMSESGALSDLVGGIPGLTIKPRASSTALLWSSSQAGTLSLFARTAANAAPVRLPVRTTAEKCVWAPGAVLIAYCAAPRSVSSASFLSAWYSGALHTSDSFWRVDVSSGTAEQFFSPDASVTLDVIDPVIDASGTYIAFRNSIDNTPWMLRVAE